MSVNQKENARRFRIRKHGIEPELYTFLCDLHNNRCFICDEPETRFCPQTGETNVLVIDHCHATGIVRGLACHRCNAALGFFNDDIALLRQTITYLEVSGTEYSNFVFTKPSLADRAKERKMFLSEMSNRHMKNIWQYGISIEIFLATMKSQNNLCLICKKSETACDPTGKVKRLSIDHDDDTKMVRGLLCNNCNLGIGLFKHDAVKVKKAIKYLEDFKSFVDNSESKTKDCWFMHLYDQAHDDVALARQILLTAKADRRKQSTQAKEKRLAAIAAAVAKRKIENPNFKIKPKTAETVAKALATFRRNRDNRM